MIWMALIIIGVGVAIGYALWRLVSLSVYFTIVPQYDDRHLWLMITITAPNNPISIMRIEALNQESESSRCQRSLYGHKFPFPLQAGQILPGKLVLADTPDEFPRWTQGRTTVSVYELRRHKPSRRTIRIKVPPFSPTAIAA